VDPLYIEETDDWLGCPTPVETCRHQLALYENEFEELNLQLRQAREQIFKLVEMHAAAATERDQLRTELAAAKSEAEDANRRATDIETKSNWELMAKDKHIADLRTQIRILSGDSPFKDPFPHQRDNS
jgi:septal ring factor EnvC (AmiA/AmiB activator)